MIGRTTLGPGHEMATADLVAAIRRFRGRKSRREICEWLGYADDPAVLEKVYKLCRQYEIATLPERERESARVRPTPVKRGRGADLTGETFGRWTVLERADFKPEGSKQSWWLCRCSCAAKTERPMGYDNLTQGGTKSCGCLRLEANARKAAATARG